ncbi:MAG: DNA mismatch repair endonuclease MutL [Thermodesulfovibrionales bacterium]
MPLIKVLPIELRNKIAAGEVIERPASVVKELVENSIDAGSTEIKIEILKAGKGLIKVTDNGTGMDREDALLCIERHATSKLFEEEDLFNINTLGFRGEAIPSIASVSRMRIITGQKGNDSGTFIEIEGGKVKEIKDYPAIGTVVEVRNLFFNTPARKKFMRADSTESLHIIEHVTMDALAHYEIGFSLIMDHREIMRLSPSGSEEERIIQIYGQEFFEGLLKVSSEKDGLAMTSYVSKEENFRNKKSHQFIFVNKRPVKDPLITHAVYQAYEGLPRDKHPLFFLYLTVNPKEVDVNVHPSTREVRFSERDRIYLFVRDNVRGSLIRGKREFVRAFVGEDVSERTSISTDISDWPFHISEEGEFGYRPSIPFIYLGETFVALSGKDGLVLLDHHAAHERVLYERFLKGKGIDSFRLLFPRQVKLTALEYNTLLNNSSLLNDMGIEIDDFGQETLIVRSLPIALKDADLNTLLSDLASALIEGERPEKRLKETVAAKIACHNSIRGRGILSHQEIQALISDLEETDDPDHCPHGRPTRIYLSLNDLRRMFRRPTR